MNRNKHLEKAERLDFLQAKMDPDSEWEIIVETVYGSSLHYIAYYCEITLSDHLNSHKGLPKFLTDNNLEQLAVLFRELEMHRQGKWYGAQGDGETVVRVRSILENVKSVCGLIGKEG